MSNIGDLNIPIRSTMALITLSSMKGFGRVAIEKIIAKFDQLDELINASDDELKILNTTQRDNIRNTSFVIQAHKEATKQYKSSKELGSNIISIYDDLYPERLKQISDAPLILHVAGDLSILKHGVSFVGTREPTNFGERAARGISFAAAQSGCCVISGLAKGIDAACHNAAIDAKGLTCAVLASGLDHYTSEAAMMLAKRILDNGGLLITEYPLGTTANKGNYIKRDRLITGLSLATFFIQGQPQSGSMHSVRYAISQNKPVYVPNIPDNFIHEDINTTARKLSKMTMSDIATELKWTGRVMDVIKDKRDDIAANLIMNKDDYPELFAHIKKLNNLEPAHSPQHN